MKQKTLDSIVQTVKTLLIESVQQDKQVISLELTHYQELGEFKGESPAPCFKITFKE